MLSLLVREVSAQILVVLVCHCCVVMLLVRIEAKQRLLTVIVGQDRNKTRSCCVHVEVLC